MKAPFPLRASGVVGNDEAGKDLMAEAFPLGIDISASARPASSRPRPPTS
jgi:hypothetical protein